MSGDVKVRTVVRSGEYLWTDRDSTCGRVVHDWLVNEFQDLGQSRVVTHELTSLAQLAPSEHLYALPIWGSSPVHVSNVVPVPTDFLNLIASEQHGWMLLMRSYVQSHHATMRTLDHLRAFRAIVIPAIREPAVTASPTNSHLRKLYASLGRARSLSAGWAGPGSTAPTAASLAIAHKVLSSLDESALPNSSSPSGDGEIGFFWRRSRGDIDMMIDTDGYITWFAKKGENIVPGDELKFINTLPETFFSLLQSIS